MTPVCAFSRPASFFRLHVAALIAALQFLVPCSRAHADELPLWTQVPTRIDRSAQHYQRLPPVRTSIDRRTWLAIPDRILVLDSARFQATGKVYRIADIHPVDPKRICKIADGGRWACGRMGAVMIGNLVRATRILCKVSPGKDDIVLEDCLSGRRDVAETIISAGLGRVAASSKLAIFQTEAQIERKGLWANPACLDNFDHC